MQSLGKYFIDRRFKSYEHELEIKKSQHQSELDFLFTKATKLHEKRLIIMQNLYKKLVVLTDKMHIMTSPFKQVTGHPEIDEKEEKERVKQAGDSYNVFRDYYLRNRIFFSEDTCILLDDIQSDFFDSLFDYTAGSRLGIMDSQFNYENALKASKTIREKIPPALEKLEREFRNIIGV